MNGGSNRIIPVAVGIIFKEGNVLCCRRRKDARYGLQWEFPGGKLHEGESPESCLRRELYEELGITIHELDSFDRKVALYEDSGLFEVHYFLIRDFTGTIRNNVFEEVAWIAPSDFDRYEFLKGNISILERLKSLSRLP